MRTEGDAAVTQVSGTALVGENLAKPRLNVVDKIRNFTTKAPYFTLLSVQAISCLLGWIFLFLKLSG